MQQQQLHAECQGFNSGVDERIREVDTGKSLSKKDHYYNATLVHTFQYIIEISSLNRAHDDIFHAVRRQKEMMCVYSWNFQNVYCCN